MTDYYDPTGVPATGTAGLSSVIRAEFLAVQSGLSGKLPVFGTNGAIPVFVNTAETGLEARSTGPYLFGSKTEVILGTENVELQIHTASRSLAVSRWSANATGMEIALGKSRSSTVGVAGTALNNGDRIVNITGYGDDGTDMTNPVAQIAFEAEAAFNTDQTPGRMVFSLTPLLSNTLVEVLRIQQDTRISMVLTQDDDGADDGPVLNLYRFSASAAAADEIGIINFQGRNSEPGDISYTSVFSVIETPTDGSEDGEQHFAQIRAGVVRTQVKMGDGVIIRDTGDPVGVFKGLGSINAISVWSDGTQLTDYVFDAAFGGGIDYAFYDRVPHAGPKARAFDADLLNIDHFCASVRARCALPAFPTNAERFDEEGEENRQSLGDQIQRLVETCELLAVHIVQLHEGEQSP